MPVVNADLAHVQANAWNILTALKSPVKPGCGGKGAAWCKQREILMLLGWLDPKLYTQAKIGAYSKPAIERLQRAIGAKVDGDWGPKTSGVLTRVLEAATGKKVDAGAVAKPQAQLPAPGPEPAPGLPAPAPNGEEGGFLQAGIPWWIPVGLLAVAGVGAWFAFRKGKKVGLEGCSGPMDGHDDEEDEPLPPEVAEEVEQLKKVPIFKPERAGHKAA